MSSEMMDVVAEMVNAADETVVISSYLTIVEAERATEVLAQIEALPGVELHGNEFGQHVVSIEAPSVDETYRRATEISLLPGVVTFSLVYCNFEDETLRRGC